MTGHSVMVAILATIGRFSNVLPLLSYQFSFQQFKFGVGAATGSFAFVIVLAVALLYVRTLDREAAE